MNKEDATRLTRQLRDKGAEYKRYPTEEGDVVLFDRALHNAGQEEIPLDDLDFEAMADTPEGRRFSGSLGNQPTPAEEGESISVRVELVIAEPGEGHTLAEAWEEAMRRTRELNPGFDKNELEDALSRRTQAYKAVLLEQGGIIHFTSTGHERVSSNSYIGWDYNELDDRELWKMDLPRHIRTPD